MVIRFMSFKVSQHLSPPLSIISLEHLYDVMSVTIIDSLGSDFFDTYSVDHHSTKEVTIFDVILFLGHAVVFEYKTSKAFVTLIV